jgi:hypothetical protein
MKIRSDHAIIVKPLALGMGRSQKSGNQKRFWRDPEKRKAFRYASG